MLGRADEIRSWGSYTNVPLTPGEQPIALASPVVPPKASRVGAAAGVAAGPRRRRAECRRGGRRDDRARRGPGRSVRECGAGARRGLGVGRTARRRRPVADHLFAQGVHPGHPSVPRQLPLLHLRHRARASCVPRDGHVSGARRDSRHRPPRRRTGLQGSAIHARRPARGRAGPRPGSGSTSAATTPRWTTCGRWRSGCWRRPGCCRT